MAAILWGNKASWFIGIGLPTRSSVQAAGNGAALLTRHLFELQHDAQRGRDFGHVLLSFGGASQQPGKLPPRELGAVLGGQVLRTR